MSHSLSVVCYIGRKRQRVAMHGVNEGQPKARMTAGHETCESSENREQLEGLDNEGHMDAA
jgi:hypothetical protein